MLTFPATTYFSPIARIPGIPRFPLQEVSPSRQNRVVSAQKHSISYSAIGNIKDLLQSTCRRIFENMSYILIDYFDTKAYTY